MVSSLTCRYSVYVCVFEIVCYAICKVEEKIYIIMYNIFK